MLHAGLLPPLLPLGRLPLPALLPLQPLLQELLMPALLLLPLTLQLQQEAPGLRDQALETVRQLPEGWLHARGVQLMEGGGGEAVRARVGGGRRRFNNTVDVLVRRRLLTVPLLQVKSLIAELRLVRGDLPVLDFDPGVSPPWLTASSLL